MSTTNLTLKTIQKSLALEETPELTANLYDDLNTHPADLEVLRELLETEFDIEFEANELEETEFVEDIVNLVKDKVGDIS